MTTAEAFGELDRQTRRYLTKNRESSSKEKQMYIDHDGESSARFRAALFRKAWRIGSSRIASSFSPRLLSSPSFRLAARSKGNKRVPWNTCEIDDPMMSK